MTADVLERKATLAELVGAFVLEAQDVERTLKFVVPWLDKAELSLDTVLARRRTLKRKTFGELVERFRKGVDIPAPDFDRMLRTLKKRRNDVVHHFAETYGARLSAGQGADVAADLRRMLRDAMDLQYIVNGYALAILESLRLGCLAGPGNEEFADVCERFRRHVGAIEFQRSDDGDASRIEYALPLPSFRRPRSDS